jgi:tetratricopeptide (TPR) repeat protein
MRIDDWRDELRFWVVTARSASGSPTIALGELANVLYRDRDYTDALPIYRAVASTDSPIGRRHLSNVAASLSMLGRYDEALVIRQALIDVDAANPRRYFDAGLVHLHARRFDPARAALERAIALAPDYEEAQRMLAMTSEAEAAWPGLAALVEGDPARARWLARIGARVEAQRAYLALVARTETSPADVLAAAQYLVDEGDLEAAEASVLRAAAVAPPVGYLEIVSGLEGLVLERRERTARIQAALPDVRALLGSGS